MWFSRAGLLLLFLYVTPSSGAGNSDTIIKDAIISLAHIMRDNTQRLERHEMREKSLGEYLNKTMIALSERKCGSTVIEARLEDITERFADIESLISQADERAQIQIEKTTNAIDNLEKRMIEFFHGLEESISKINLNLKPNDPSTQMGEAEREPKIPTIYSEVQEIGTKLNGIQTSLGNLENLSKTSTTQAEVAPENAASTNLAEVVSRVLDTETQILGRVEGIEHKLRNISNANENCNTLQSNSMRSVQDVEKKINGFGKSLRDIEELARTIEKNRASSTTEETTALNRIATKLNETTTEIARKVDDVKVAVHSIANSTKRGAATYDNDMQTLRNVSEKINAVGTSLREVHELATSIETNRAKSADEELTTLNKFIVNFNQTKTDLFKKVDDVKSGVDGIVNGANNDEESTVTKLEAISGEVGTIKTRLENINSTLGKIQEFLKKAGEKAVNETTVSRTGIANQNETLGKVQELLDITRENIASCPRTSDVRALHNETLATLQATKHALEDVINGGFNGLNSQALENREEIKTSIGTLRADLAVNAEHVSKELDALASGRAVMVSTADHVLDTKKKVEYGVHQILLGVSDLIRSQSGAINKTFHQKFDTIASSIINNHSNALANLTVRMEQEMDLIWRQINTMYGKITGSTEAIEKLRQQNEAYVNGTSTTIDGMKTKVGDIRTRIAEFEDNLSYLLGRLSLVTHEFDKVKTKLTSVLDNIRASFVEIQKEADDSSHPISSRYPDMERAPQSKSDLTNFIGN